MAREEFDAQQELNNAFEDGDLRKFRIAIGRGAQTNLSSKQDEQDGDNQMSIFEKALSKPDSGQFIRACLDTGCDPNYVNTKLNKAAINYVADSQSPNNLYTLLSQSNCKVDIDHQFEQETALSILIKSLKHENAHRLTDCIRLLLKNGASPNFVDLEGKTPLQHLLANDQISQEDRSILIIEFLKLPELQHNYIDGLDFLLKYYLDGHCSLLYKLLVRQLLKQDVVRMISTLSFYQKRIVGWNHKKMLHVLIMEHITKQTLNALEAVIATLEINTSEENEYLVELAIEECSWSTLLCLLKSKFLRNLPTSNLLKTMIKQLQVRPLTNHVQSSEYEECLLQLLKDEQHCLNLYDEHHNTPLHYAILGRNEIAIRVLLREGARLGMRNEKNRLVIEDMDAKLLEEHFDYCITARGGKSNHEEYEIILNYLNMTNDRNELDIAPIACMAQSRELCPLLEHPLITCFLQLKWRRLATMFFSHFVIYVILGLILWYHVYMRFPKPNGNELCIQIVSIVFIVLISYVVIVELLTYVIVKHPPSYIDLPLIALLILTCIRWGDQRIIAVLAIMMMAIKLMDLIGALPVPAISTHLLMLRQVASTFAKSLLHYSLLLPTFSLCFYVLFADSKDPEVPANSTDSSIELSFDKLDVSLMKTLAMFNGQYDDDDFKGFFNIIVLTLFMFMAMVLTNLLGGLAVDDTQTIRDKVKRNAAICRTNLLFKCEGVLNKRWPRFERVLRIFQKLMRIHSESICGYVSIFPNQENQAKVCSERRRNRSIEKLTIVENCDNDHQNTANGSEYKDDEVGVYVSTTRKFCAFDIDERNSNLTIESGTVNEALKIIKEQEKKNIEEQREELTEQRLEDIRAMLMELKYEYDSKKTSN